MGRTFRVIGKAKLLCLAGLYTGGSDGPPRDQVRGCWEQVFFFFIVLQSRKRVAEPQPCERFENFVHHLWFPSFVSFQALFFLTHYSADCFLCIYECTAHVIIFFVDPNVWEYACFKLAQDTVTGRSKICAAAQSEAWALEKSFTKPSFFLYFREIRNKRSNWPGGQSAPRHYNSYNLCLCAKPAYVGECWPGPEFKFSKTVEVGWSCSNLQLCQREIATDEIQERKKDREHSKIKSARVCTDGLSATQNGRRAAERLCTHRESNPSRKTHCASP